MADGKKADDPSSSTRPRAESSKQGGKSNSDVPTKHETRPSTASASLDRPSVTYILEYDPSDLKIEQHAVVEPETKSAPKSAPKSSIQEDKSGDGWGKRKPRTFSNITQKLNKKGSLDAETSATESAKPSAREKFLSKTLINMILYFIFIILVTIMAVGMVFPSMYYLTRALTELFITKPFMTNKNLEITFMEITNVDEFWAYSRTVPIKGFYWDYWYLNETSDEENKIILYENKLIGVPRFRQLKVKNNTCKISYIVNRKNKDCYAHFSKAAEDQESFGLKTETAWKFYEEEDLESIAYTGKIATYHGGGFYQEFGTNRQATAEIIEILQKNLWITRGTRCVFLDFVIYNPNLNLFCVAKLIFEFSPTGSVIPSYSFKTVKLIRYVTTWDYFVKTCEWLCILFLIYYFVEEAVEIFYYKKKYFYHFWNYVDLAVVIVGLVCIIFFLSNESKTLQTVSNNIHLIRKYANFEYVAQLQIRINIFVGILLFLTYIKIFKYLGFNKHMGQLNSTLQRCGADIAAFAILAFIMFAAYAQLGYLLFGTHVEGYHSVGHAMFTLFRTILGDFDYTKIEEVNANFAAFFFLTYIFIVFFVLLNMFLAIINDTYADVKSNLAAAPSELQMYEYLKDRFYKFLSKCGCSGCIRKETIMQSDYDVTLEEIRNALKRCGFTEIEIQMFFEKFNIDPTAEVGDFDVELLMNDLEEITKRTKEFDFKSGGLVTPQDYIAQEVRIGEMEDTVYVINAKVESLLRRLDSIDIAKKAAYSIPK